MAATATDPGSDVLRLAPWCPAILEAAVAFEVDPYLLAGMCLRETRAGWARGYTKPGQPDGWADDPDGDGPMQKQAFGLMCIDRRFHAMFVNSPDASDPRAQFMYAAELVADARDYFRRQFPRAPEALILDASVASYNAGPGRVGWAIRQGQRPDSVTTHGDYAADVQRRAFDLKHAHPHLFMPKPAEVA